MNVHSVSNIMGGGVTFIHIMDPVTFTLL